MNFSAIGVLPMVDEVEIQRRIEDRYAKIQAQQNIQKAELTTELSEQCKVGPQEQARRPVVHQLDEPTFLRRELLTAKRRGLAAEQRLLRLQMQELQQRVHFLQQEEAELAEKVARQVGISGPVIIQPAAKSGFVEITPVPTPTTPAVY